MRKGNARHMEQKIFQVSTLQALAMGYSRAVVTVGELLQHGDIGLGTYEDVNGEMILLDGECFRAEEDGDVIPVGHDTGVPFAVAAFLRQGVVVSLKDVGSIDALKQLLDLKIEEDFGLNSMHIVRVDGSFAKICARSESAYRSHHVSLKEILQKTQKDFFFEDIRGTLVCVYFPDYMDGINAPGWHLHFISEDRRLGGHVFDLEMTEGTATVNKISQIQIQLPSTPAFDTYSLKEASHSEIKEVEQGK